MAEDTRTMLAELAALKQMETQIAKRKTDIQTALIDAMSRDGLKVVSTDLGDGAVIKGTLVAAERVVIDEARLKGVLAPKTWKKVTKEVLDSKLLEAAVAMGDIDAMTVASVSETVHNKPYIKVSGDIAAAKAVTISDDSGRVKPAARRVKAKK